MQKFFGRAIGFLFLGSFCAAGPLLLAIALVVTVQRTWLIADGERADGLVIAKQSSPGKSHPTFAPVFQFKANGGQIYTVTSDVSGRESAFTFGQHVPVLYHADDPSAARIDAFGQLWTLPLVAGTVGAAFSLIPAFVVVTWIKRRRGIAGRSDGSASTDEPEGASRGLRMVLGVLLTGGGVALLIFGAMGLAPVDPSNVRESRVMGTLIGILLVSSGVMIGQWVPDGSRRQNALGGAAILSMALMFGWVALYGEASGFSGGVAIGGAAVGSSGHVTLARIAFGVGSVLCAVASLPAWRRVFRSSGRQ